MPVVDDISIRLTDAKGEHQRVHIYAPIGATFAEITSYTNLMLPLLDDITEAQITAVTLQRQIVLPGGLKAAPVAGSDVQEGGNILFDISASNYNHSIRIGALLQSLFNGREVDIADVTFIAWANSITNGLATVVPSDEKGGDLLGVIEGKKTFHK